MTEVVTIEARDVRVGDVWLGEDGVRLEVIWVNTSPQVLPEPFIPWEKGRNHPPVLMRPVVITGNLLRPDEKPWRGNWTLQPDMPIEVERG